MWSLFCDQSFEPGVVALFHEGNVIEASFPDLKGAANTCQAWEHLLESHGLRLQDIAFVACGIGPGSYTGIRCSVATAKAVSFATRMPIVAVSSLLLFALPHHDKVWIMVDAGAGGVYAQRVVSFSDQYQADPPVRMEQDLLCVPDGAVVVTNDVCKLTLALSRHYRIDSFKALISQAIEVRPSLVPVARIAYQEWHVGHYLPGRSISPLYLRKTQAEVNAARS